MIETLPHDWYHDADIFDVECDRIFRKHWWLIGPESEFAEAGDYQAFNLLQWPLVVVRDKDSELRGFYNLCRHRAGPLVIDPACGVNSEHSIRAIHEWVREAHSEKF